MDSQIADSDFEDRTQSENSDITQQLSGDNVDQGNIRESSDETKRSLGDSAVEDFSSFGESTRTEAQILADTPKSDHLGRHRTPERTDSSRSLKSEGGDSFSNSPTSSRDVKNSQTPSKSNLSAREKLALKKAEEERKKLEEEKRLQLIREQEQAKSQQERSSSSKSFASASNASGKPSQSRSSDDVNGNSAQSTQPRKTISTLSDWCAATSDNAAEEKLYSLDEFADAIERLVLTKDPSSGSHHSKHYKVREVPKGKEVEPELYPLNSADIGTPLPVVFEGFVNIQVSKNGKKASFQKSSGKKDEEPSTKKAYYELSVTVDPPVLALGKAVTDQTKFFNDLLASTTSNKLKPISPFWVTGDTLHAGVRIFEGDKGVTIYGAVKDPRTNSYDVVRLASDNPSYQNFRGRARISARPSIVTVTDSYCKFVFTATQILLQLEGTRNIMGLNVEQHGQKQVALSKPKHNLPVESKEQYKLMKDMLLQGVNMGLSAEDLANMFNQHFSVSRSNISSTISDDRLVNPGKRSQTSGKSSQHRSFIDSDDEEDEEGEEDEELSRRRMSKKSSDKGRDSARESANLDFYAPGDNIARPPGTSRYKSQF